MKKKLVILVVFILLSVPFVFLYFLGGVSLLTQYSDRGYEDYIAMLDSSYSFKCNGNKLYSPLGVLGSYYGSPFLQIKCTSNTSSNALGFWYPNNTPTDVLVTKTISNSISWSSGHFLAVPHPSMSTCQHIQSANFSSLFHNFRSFHQFNLQIDPHSSLLVFNCSSPRALSESEYPRGFSRAGSPCTQFTEHCLQHKGGSISNSSLDCFELSSSLVNNSNSTEALIAKLGCSSFTSYNIFTEFYSAHDPWNFVTIQWKNLPNEDLCDNTIGVCGYSRNGSLIIHCSNGQNLTDQKKPCAINFYKSTWPLYIFISGYSTVAILIVVCAVKRESVMLLVTGEKYFKIEDFSEPPKKMSYRLLEWATQSFSNKIGEGSFGQVFFGVLPRVKTPLAVKVLDNARHSHRQFVAEIESIGNIHHLNLVHLIGFCSHKAKRLLVYEFIPNGSLDKHLFSNEKEKEEEAMSMSWERRYSIIMGVARGLAYLHHECRQQVVHLDIKPANILLDHHFNAKIADFGLSKLMTIDQSKAATAVRGTPGYVAPELWKDSIVSTKCDVYSFGVLVIEVIAGRKWLEIDASSSQLYLPDWAFKKACQEDFLPLIDERVACPEIIEQARILILLSMWCIQQDPCLRPTMIKVLEFIEGKDYVPLNPPNPFGSALNIEDPDQ